MKSQDKITKKSLSDKEKKYVKMELGQNDKDLYTEEGRDEELENDEISAEEQAFMEGASDDGGKAKCANCGEQVDRSQTVEEEIEDVTYWFCSDRCAQKYIKKHKK